MWRCRIREFRDRHAVVQIVRCYAMWYRQAQASALRYVGTCCTWHTAYYWVHNKLPGKLSTLLSARDVKSRARSEGTALWSSDRLYTGVLSIFAPQDYTRRLTGRANCNRVCDNFPLIFCTLIFLFRYFICFAMIDLYRTCEILYRVLKHI